MKKRIISVALTGSWGRLDRNPFIPMTPDAIAADVKRCRAAGAAIAHLHMRDEAMQPRMDVRRFAETIALIREDCDIIINMTSSGDPDGSDDVRLAPLSALKPEMASFDCGTMNWMHNSIFENHPRFLKKLGRLMQDHGIKPEIEIFDAGMLETAKYYLGTGLLKAPAHFQFVLGAPGGMAATVQDLAFLHAKLPPGSTWSATGISSGHLSILFAALAMGGHIRVGLEDNLYFSKGVLATNVMLTERAARLVGEYGCEPASPDEAREILGIKAGPPGR
jgi:uncharacterized protein (DUF849 family)